MIIFSLIETSFLRNNELFKRNSTKSKGNRIVKMGKLLLTNSLTNYQTLFCKNTNENNDFMPPKYRFVMSVRLPI
jgi:hypothetical protein